MRILYIHQYFCTPQGAGGSRSYEFARRWVASGHEVTVITAKSFDETLPGQGWANIEGIRVRVIGGRYAPEMGFFARLKSFFQFAFASTWLAAKAREYDVVLATSTPLTIAFPALAAKLIARRPTVFEVRDVWPDAAIDAGVLKNPALIYPAKLLEKAAYRYSDHIVPLSSGMAERLVGKGIAESKMTVVPNCCDLDRFDPAQFNRESLRRQRQVDGKLVLLYMGAINLANDMPFLASAIKELSRDTEVVWWFIGSGNRVAYLEEQVRACGAENVKFFGKIPKHELPQYVAAADLGVVSFINRPVYYENSPNKFFDYSAGGLPAVFTRTSWLSPYLEKYGAGFVCKGNTVAEFCEIVRAGKANLSAVHAMRAQVRRMAEQEFSRDIYAARYLDLLRKASGAAANHCDQPERACR